jgi:hypothetical protein
MFDEYLAPRQPPDHWDRELTKAIGEQAGDHDLNRGGSTPGQYGLPDGAIELQDLIEYRGMNFAVGNIFKAAYRLGNCDHSDAIRDLNKIIWFANREKSRHLNQVEE